jgi:hypothetical protein
VATLENCLRFLNILNIKLPFDPGCVLLNIHTRAYSRMFMRALFKIAKRVEKPKCSSTGDG